MSLPLSLFHPQTDFPSFSRDYLPRLVPVEVKETKARQWFISLLGAITFLHSKGVVHNDIKPANVLLSRSEA
jgi:serine/threonine protein kinase